MTNSSKTEEVGLVRSIRGKIALVDGFPTIKVGELVMGENGAKGYIAGLFPNWVEVYLLTDEDVEPGQMFKKSGGFLGIKAGDNLLGRVINPLGESLDEQPALKDSPKDEKIPLEENALGISKRRYIKEQFETGITVIDTLFPLGKGQRELVIGESRAGKTGFLLDIIANQKGSGVICVFAMIGKPLSEVRDIYKQIKDKGLLEHSILVVSTSDDTAPMSYLAPQTAFAIADFFRKKGRDVLLILDDMGIHARNYRELSLVSGRAPGRESYPGDIFYQHARLLERAGCFADGGSITALPVIELSLSDFQAFIPTNLMGMTDGHLLFRSDLAQQGQTPAVDISLSVTRVGSQTQQRLQNAMSMKIKETLARGKQFELVSSFGTELPEETKLILIQKGQIEELLIQRPGRPLSLEMQTVLLALPFTQFLKNKDRTLVKNNYLAILDLFEKDSTLKKIRDEVFKNKNIEELIGLLDGAKDKLEAGTILPENTKKEEIEEEDRPQPIGTKK